MATFQSCRKFDRYKENCSIVTTEDGDFVKSYNTLVAKIDYSNSEIQQLGWWSMTTQKHINYVANQFNFKLKK